ncbi:hypothetical protein DAPPUDRAFT_120731 [Daphnia pulex]|uniref:Uncharacterized protein n=1 Tax=Daphnia pulex TaxID=6669 RepID=E9I236_DAPPU|nr:hypothetical protein DAPPUDRAFT_120731 [Daphnia pulex]|eukprot:EFX61944.1 hypothetical protein DAPPUDRAFT_120731 [Daphnia pulex]
MCLKDALLDPIVYTDAGAVGGSIDPDRRRSCMCWVSRRETHKAQTKKKRQRVKKYRREEGERVFGWVTSRQQQHQEEQIAAGEMMEMMSDDSQHVNMSDISSNWHGLEIYPLDVSTEDDLLLSINNTSSSNRPPSPIESLLGELSGSHSLIFMENAEEMLLPWKNNPNFLPIVLTHVVTFVIGLAGNIVVISTMSRGHGERSVTRSASLEYL